MPMPMPMPMPMMMMPMWFTFGYNNTFLFENFYSNNGVTYWCWLILIFIVCIGL